MNARDRAVKSKSTRTYTLRRRAEQQAGTRRRIVEAAVALHASVGPAATTLSMIAERAGVQRHTLYAHFPEEKDLFLACSALTMERDPLPDAEPWRAIAEPRERLRAGLSAIYDWYERNASLAGSVLRDAEHHAPTAEIVEMRFGPYMTSYAEVLGARLGTKQHAVLRLALSFYTWRSLVRDGGLATGRAAEVMVRAIECAKRAPAP
jgi:AcrR family transcriptional regulator